MSLEEIREILEQLASDEDPIYIYKSRGRCVGLGTTINEISHTMKGRDPSKMIVGYYSKDGFVYRGTFQGMIRDRADLSCNQEENVDVDRSYDDIVRNLPSLGPEDDS